MIHHDDGGILTPTKYTRNRDGAYYRPWDSLGSIASFFTNVNASIE